MKLNRQLQRQDQSQLRPPKKAGGRYNVKGKKAGGTPALLSGM